MSLTVERARNRIAELEETVRQLREDICPPGFEIPGDLRFSKHEQTILKILLTRGGAKRQVFIGAMYADHPNGGVEYEDRILSMEIHSLRRKLAAEGVKIRTTYRWGYDMSEESREKLRSLIERHQKVDA